MNVTVHVGLTFHMGPASSNQYGRLDVTFADIDSTVPLAEQIQGGVGVARKAFEAALVELDRQVEEVIGGKTVARR